MKRTLSLNLIAFLAAIALAGCLECRPGDRSTTNGRDLCPAHSRTR